MSVGRWVALGALAFLALARLMSSFDPLPGWGVDPASSPTPIVGIGPAASIAIDIGLLVVAAVACASPGRGAHADGARPDDVGLTARARGAMPVVAIALGGVGGLTHGLWGEGLRIDDLRLGLAWIGAFAGAMAAARLAAEPMARRALLAVLLGAGVLLTAKGAMQVFVEHESTVRAFRADREAFVSAQGWSPDSAQARAFERRLSEPAPLGFLGLTNVYLSVTLSCAVGLGAWALCAWRGGADATRVRDARTRVVLMVLLGLGAVGCGASAAFGPIAGGSVAKGPIGALALAALGTGTIAAASRGPGRGARTGGLAGSVIALGLVAIPLAAVVARGVVGERLGELSLLFRWFYMMGSARIIADAPVLGVGPDGFQAAYMIAKPVLSPENVVSPHSVLLDWTATLGVFGAALGLAWLGWVARLGRTAWDDAVPADTGAERWRAAGAWLAGVIGAVVAWQWAWDELPIARAVPGSEALIALEGLVRLVAWGLAWAVAAGAALCLGSERAVRIGALAAALLVAAHAQIEMTLTTPGSATWAFVVLGAACAAGASERAHSERAARACARRVGGALVLGGLAAAAGVALPSVARWEHRLRNSAAGLHEVARVESGVRQQELSFEAAAAELEALGGQRPRTPVDFGRAFEALRLARTTGAIDALDAAARAAGEHAPTLRAGAQSASAAEARALAAGLGERVGLSDRAVALATRAVERGPDDAASWSSLAAALRARAAGHGAGSEAWRADLIAAGAALERGDGLDPHGRDFPRTLADLHAGLGDAAEAARWARVALDRDSNLRLDPVARLAERDRRRLERVAGGG